LLFSNIFSTEKATDNYNFANIVPNLLSWKLNLRRH